MTRMDTVFKAYDIRGTVPDQLDAAMCRAIGRAVARWSGPREPRAHCATRPPVSETASVAVALELAAATDVRLHIYHASLPRTFELVAAARGRGQRVTAETCPHYLLLTEDDMDRLGPLGKMNPPLRSPAAASGLWERLADGTVDLVSSDHSPWALEKKSRRDDIFANSSGLPGVETLVPLMYGAAVGQRGLPISRLAEVLAATPAATFGLAPRKGQLAVGADADLIVLDPSGTTRIRGQALHSSARWSPYDGMEVPGRIALTMVRGRIVYDGSAVIGTPGYGQYVTPARSRTGPGA